MIAKQLILGILFTIMPITELRVGLPIIVDYCLKNQFPIFPFFSLVIFFNVLVIFLAYSFLEFIHPFLMKWKFYKKIFDGFINRARKKREKFEEKFGKWGYLAMVIFVAVPLPGTGAWMGVLIAWLLGLEKKKTTLAISLGVLLAGIIMLSLSVGFLKIFY